MSQRIQRLLAVVGLVATLALTLPAPSRAVGLWEPRTLTLAAHAWGWLEGLGLIPRRAAVPASRQPLSVREKQGSAIDPNGRIAPSAPTTTQVAKQGSAIDPNGGE